MFAHYAKGHTGLCLTYEIDPRDMYPVSYDRDLPRLELLEVDAKKIVKACLCTKHVDWQYEREHRLVLYDRDPGLYENERLRLTEISVGHAMSQVAEREVTALARDSRFSAVSVWRMNPAPATYGLERVRIA